MLELFTCSAHVECAYEECEDTPTRVLDISVPAIGTSKVLREERWMCEFHAAIFLAISKVYVKDVYLS